MKKTVTKKELAAATKLAYEARAKESELKEQYRQQVQLPKFKAMVGKCFRTSNSYGGDSKAWWLYARILEINDDVNFVVERFQHTEDDRIEFERREELTYFHMPFEDWQKITPTTYFAARNKILGILEERGK